MPKLSSEPLHAACCCQKSTNVAFCHTLCRSGPAPAPPTTPVTTVSRLVAAPALPRVRPCTLLLPGPDLPGCRLRQRGVLLLPGAAPPGCEPALLPLARGNLPGPLLLLLPRWPAPPRCGAALLLLLPRATLPRCRPPGLLPQGAPLCMCRPALLIVPRAALPRDGLALLMPARAAVPRCSPALLLLHRWATAPATALAHLLLGPLG